MPAASTAPPPPTDTTAASNTTLAGPAPDARSVPADNAPLIAYTQHSKPPGLIDMTVGSAELGLIGLGIAVSAGKDIVERDGIIDPSTEMARQIAAAYAAAHGLRVASDPIPDAPNILLTKPDKLAAEANGARYVVDVNPPGMELIYFSLDWTHRDLMFLSSVRIIDATNGKVVANARCFIKTKKTPDLMTHDQLQENHSAGLKLLIQHKTDACMADLKTHLKI